MRNNKIINLGRNKVEKKVNWNDLLNADLSNIDDLIIEVESLDKDAERDLAILERLKNFNLDSIEIQSLDYNILIYFSSLFKDVSIPVDARLLGGFENRDISNINLDGLMFRTVHIPIEYILWNNFAYSNIEFYKNNCTLANKHTYSYVSSKCIQDEDLKKIDDIISEWTTTIPDLTLVDKVVLVSNYIQSQFQYVWKGEDRCGDKIYIVENREDIRGYDTTGEDVHQLLERKIGACGAIGVLTTLMLSNPKMNVNCRGVTGPKHFFNLIYDNNNVYLIDNTWGITRNPNIVPGALRATEFCGAFLTERPNLNVSPENYNMSDHHIIFTPTKPGAIPSSFTQEQIEESKKKLERYGIKFTYPSVVYVQTRCEDYRCESDIRI